MEPSGLQFMSSLKTLYNIGKVNIDAKVGTPLLLGSTEDGTQKFWTLLGAVGVRAASGVTVVPALNIGTNAPLYNNIVSGQVMTGLDELDKSLKLNLSSAYSIIASDTDIYVNFTTIAVGTELKLDIFLYGNYN